MATDIVIPAAIRVPLAEPLGFETLDRARTAQMEVGELRRRDRYTTVPQTARVTWDHLTQAEFDAFWTWREDDLEGMSRKFDLRLERQGGPGSGSNPRIEWWTAQFVGVPQDEALRGGRYRVAATLLLIGEPFDVRVPPGILASGGIQFRGRAIVSPGRLRATGSITFGGRWINQPRAITAAGSIRFDGAWKTGIPSSVDADTEEEITRVWMRFNGTRISNNYDDARTVSFMRI